MVVDDNSPDGTGALADELAARDAQVQVLHRKGKEGLGAAYRHAFRVALDEGWDRIVQMDADFSHDPKDVPRLLAALDAGRRLRRRLALHRRAAAPRTGASGARSSARAAASTRAPCWASGFAI